MAEHITIIEQPRGVKNGPPGVVKLPKNRLSPAAEQQTLMDVEMATTMAGFPGLARNIATSPDYETFIFRKFDRLSARNLLHLESRLAYLEWKLDRADEQAMQSQDSETLRSVRAWEAFEENANDGSRPENTRMAIAEEIKKTLEEYRGDALFSSFS
ncbi:hypothetical protein NW762_011015 [Fusarium torreyae]|uniref:DUF6594 domain-containing protein n=1 Tax=Fusarium torreyae TaxID=1237075 RepID=A0A9W8RUH4_9HYPO|nr:hypothetical protein NW762_011015 [Fusarium torreyae]